MEHPIFRYARYACAGEAARTECVANDLDGRRERDEVSP
jgi:hypothetical protein